MATKTKRYPLTIFLLKDGITDLAQCAKSVSPIKVSSSISYKALLFVEKKSVQETKWQNLVQLFTDNPLSLISAHSSALLLVETQKAKYALTFGLGRNLLNDRFIQRGFGLKTVLNIVHPESIRHLDAHTFDTMTKHTVAQINRGSSVDSFGIDVQRDILRAAAGMPTDDKKWGKRVVGKDPIVINAYVKPDTLPTLLDELHEEYLKDTYKQKGFEFVDHIAEEKDTAVIDALDQLMIDALNKRAPDGIYLAPSGVISWENVSGFSFSSMRKKTDIYDELEVEDLYRFLDDHNITISDFNKLSVRTHSVSDDTILDSWSIYRCICFEASYNSKEYVFAFGTWFVVSGDFANSINRELQRIGLHTEYTFPQSTSRQSEGAYNEHVAKASGGSIALVDKKNISYGGGHSRIEVCDLFTENCHLVHVKRKTESSTLSHLFLQGLVSSQILAGDQDFRTEFLKVLPSKHRSLTQWSPFLPSSFTVVFAIISGTTKSIYDALPFFSRVSLVNQTRIIKGYGYKVELCKISLAGTPRSAPKPNKGSKSTTAGGNKSKSSQTLTIIKGAVKSTP
ncbi:DUF6119 family protein [Azospirillum largimobile]